MERLTREEVDFLGEDCPAKWEWDLHWFQCLRIAGHEGDHVTEEEDNSGLIVAQIRWEQTS